jgi:hypothetical protein
MAEEPKQQKKIIVDEDWKQQAQKEKDVMAAQEKAEQKDKPAERRRGPLPEGSFAALVSMIATQALFSLGLIQAEGQPEREPDLELARYNIDLLGVIEEKTKGNLTEQEGKVLENAVHELRMSYVAVVNQGKSQ